MTTALQKQVWETPWLEAFMWSCNDDCECFQPQINRITPNKEVGYPIVNIDPVWRGNFKCDPEPAELNFLKRQLRKEALKHGIYVDEPDWYGRIAWIPKPSL